jgi:hypothetical protein
LLALNYSNNFIEGPVPASLGSLVDLTALAGQENFQTGLLPTELGQLASLSTLTLNNNRIAGALPTELGTLTGLGTFCGMVGVLTTNFHITLTPFSLLSQSLSIWR